MNRLFNDSATSAGELREIIGFFLRSKASFRIFGGGLNNCMAAWGDSTRLKVVESNAAGMPWPLTSIR